jgi:integrase
VPRIGGHYLSIAEVASLLDAVKDSRYSPLLRLLVATGLRRGEALALPWSDVELTNGILRARGTLSRVNGHVVISEPKTERSRRDVPLSPATVTLLRSVKASQVIERLKAASIWVETGIVFTTESRTAVESRNALRAINTAGVEVDDLSRGWPAASPPVNTVGSELQLRISRNLEGSEPTSRHALRPSQSS